jgi:hypothetical protein
MLRKISNIYAVAVLRKRASKIQYCGVLTTIFTTVKSEQKQFVALTALWAFVESGLGGVLHAFHLPFTGIVLGGFSVLIISLLANRSQVIVRDVLLALLTVAAIKAIANPLTSPFAYIALTFQALWGALIYSICRQCTWAHLLFAIGAMLESAAQQLLTATLLAGKAFWVAMQGLSEIVCKIFHIQSSSHPNFTLVYIYLGIFCAWGLLLGLWLRKLPAQLHARLELYKGLLTESRQQVLVPKSRRRYPWIVLGAALFLITSFAMPIAAFKASVITFTIRAVCAILIWRYFIIPLWSPLMAKWSAQYFKKNHHASEVKAYMPWFTASVPLLIRHLKEQYTGIKFIKELALGLIVLCFHIQDEA